MSVHLNRLYHVYILPPWGLVHEVSYLWEMFKEGKHSSEDYGGYMQPTRSGLLAAANDYKGLKKAVENVLTA